MTLTYNARLVKVNLMPKIMVKGLTAQTGERPQTNGRTHAHTDATKHIISPAMWSIKIWRLKIYVKTRKFPSTAELLSLTGGWRSTLSSKRTAYNCHPSSVHYFPHGYRCLFLCFFPLWQNSFRVMLNWVLNTGKMFGGPFKIMLDKYHSFLLMSHHNDSRTCKIK